MIPPLTHLDDVHQILKKIIKNFYNLYIRANNTVFKNINSRGKKTRFQLYLLKSRTFPVDSYINKEILTKVIKNSISLQRSLCFTPHEQRFF